MDQDSGSNQVPYKLSAGDRRKLLEIARSSIEQYLRTETLPQFTVGEVLQRPGAAFVTLTRQDMLRGCIGTTVAAEPLYLTVSRCAVQAAVADGRFLPVTADELPQIDIEISVLTPTQKVASLDEIEVGRDGLVIRLGRHSGLLLPQVATDYGWDRTQFLEQTCRKAGLPPDAYKDPEATLYRFQALVFGERER